MLITISITALEEAMDSDLVTLDLPADMNIGDLKALIEKETRFAVTSQHIYHNGQLLNDATKTLQDLSIGEGEMLAMHVRDLVGETGVPPASRGLGGPAPGRAAMQRSRGQGAGGSNRVSTAGSGGPDPEMIRLQLLGDPRMLNQVRNQNPELAASVENSERFRDVFYSMQRQQAEAEHNRQREIAMLNDDPFNPENQAKIEELIRQEAVMENLQNALEHNPEGASLNKHLCLMQFSNAQVQIAFGKVHMLYIDVEVNGHKVKAFVDSGAQATIMSPSCATECGIMRLVDTRFSGIARGVGTAKILGRVHSAQIKIGSLFLACSFTVMEGKDVDLLLGLDMLKRHQACIDLQRNMLVIQNVEVPFLGEADIPKSEEELLDEPTVEGPGGAKVGARSGAVLQPPAAVAPPMPDSSSASGSSGSGSFRGQGQALGGSGALSPRRGQPRADVSHAQHSRTSSRAQYPQEAIEQLQQLGFSREEAIAALSATDGNVDLAARLLFQ